MSTERHGTGEDVSKVVLFCERAGAEFPAREGTRSARSRREFDAEPGSRNNEMLRALITTVQEVMRT
jgi:hypothetical protein